MSINDINEAIVAGHSVMALELASTPMHVENSRARVKTSREGFVYLKTITEEVINAPTTEQKKEIILDMHDKIEAMATAWLNFEAEMARMFIKIRGFRGLAGEVDSVQRMVRSKARKMKKDIRSNKIRNKLRSSAFGYDPHEPTLQLLDKKWLRVGEDLQPGDPRPTKLNVEYILTKDPRWVGRIQFCELDKKCHIDKQPINDVEEAKVASWIAKTYGFEFDDRKLGKIMDMIGQKKENRYHPIQDWFDELDEWDGQHRLKDLAGKVFNSPDHKRKQSLIQEETDEGIVYWDYEHFGIKDEPATIPQIYMIRTMIAAVARALVPGCKVDNCTTIIGRQGAFKSTAIERLSVRPEWFMNSAINITKKDAYHKIAGKWIVEFAECESIERSGHNTAKNFLSTKIDHYRRTYDRHAGPQPRTCVFIATSNEKQLGFLNAPTGSRRYWVFQAGKIDIDMLDEQYVRQLWAEAKHHYHQEYGKWWLEEWEESFRQSLNDKYRQADSWEECLIDWLANRIENNLANHKLDKNKFLRYTSFSLRHALNDAVNIPSQFQKRQDIVRMTETLIRIGCRQSYRQQKKGMRRTRMWTPSNDLLLEVAQHLDHDSKGDAFQNKLIDWDLMP